MIFLRCVFQEFVVTYDQSVQMHLSLSPIHDKTLKYMARKKLFLIYYVQMYYAQIHVQTSRYLDKVVCTKRLIPIFVLCSAF